jgi:chromosome segregation ATPase
MILILGVLVVIFLVLGVFLLLKSYDDIPDPAAVVPKEELSKTLQALDAAHGQEEALKLKLDSLVVEFEKTKSMVDEAQKSGKAFEALTAQKEEYFSHIQQLQQKVAELEGQLTDAQANASEAAQADGLAEENQKLKEGLLAITARIKEVEMEFLTVKQENEQRLSETQKAATQMQEQLQLLQKEKAANEEKVKQLQGELENSRQKAQATGADASSMLALQKEKAEFEQKLQALNEMNDLLKEKEALLQSELAKSRAQALGLEKFVKSLNVA